MAAVEAAAAGPAVVVAAAAAVVAAAAAAVAIAIAEVRWKSVGSDGVVGPSDSSRSSRSSTAGDVGRGGGARRRHDAARDAPCQVIAFFEDAGARAW